MSATQTHPTRAPKGLWSFWRGGQNVLTDPDIPEGERVKIMALASELGKTLVAAAPRLTDDEDWRR